MVKNKNRKGDEKMTRKLIGTVFEAIGVCLLILTAILLMNKETIRGTIVLFLVGASLFWLGWIVSRLPSEHEKRLTEYIE